MSQVAHDQYREEVAGRADVADTPELVAYYEELSRLRTGALWTVANKIEPWQPRSESVPMLWRYADLREHVLRSVDLVTPEKAGRRVIYLENPGRTEVVAAVGWLYSGLQVMRAGEAASAHAHSASALRFIMEGKGAYTVVDGHKMTLGANDFVLTPNGTWHEHGVEASGSTCIWQDGLDIPFVNAMEAGFYAVHPELRQAVTHAVDDSTALWGAPGLKPQHSGWSKPYSPLFKYEWAPTYEALRRHAKVSAGTDVRRRADALRQSGHRRAGHAHHRRQHAAAAGRFEGKAHRHTGSYLYQVAKGRGHSIIDGRRFDWQERDIFCVPSWALHEHANASSTEDACLFCFSDLPVMQSLGLYREEALADNGGHQPVIG